MKPKPKSTRGKSGMKPLSQILFDYVLEDKGGHITKEFQDYGYRLALELNDLRSKSLYIRLAKVEERPLLEKALVLAWEIGSLESFTASSCQSFLGYKKRQLSSPLVTTAPSFKRKRNLTGTATLPLLSRL